MLRLWLTSSALISGLTILVVLGFLLHASWPLLQDQGVAFVGESEWYPYEELYGLAPVLLGSFWSVCLALLLAIPLGLSAAILAAELVPKSGRSLIRFGMELMAGIPSVVYGLLGLWILLPLLENQFDLLTGRSLLAAFFFLRNRSRDGCSLTICWRSATSSSDSPSASRAAASSSLAPSSASRTSIARW